MHASSATETYTLSLHDALPIYQDVALAAGDVGGRIGVRGIGEQVVGALARVPTFLGALDRQLLLVCAHLEGHALAAQVIRMDVVGVAGFDGVGDASLEVGAHRDRKSVV